MQSTVLPILEISTGLMKLGNRLNLFFLRTGSGRTESTFRVLREGNWTETQAAGPGTQLKKESLYSP